MYCLKKSKFLLVLFLLSLSPISVAGKFSYDYVQVTYLSLVDSSLLGDIDLDAEGSAFSGSFSLFENIALNATYGSITYDEYLSFNREDKIFVLGITGHIEFFSNTDFSVGVSAFENKTKNSYNPPGGEGESSEELYNNGNVIDLSLKHILDDTTELSLSYSEAESEGNKSDVSGIGIRFFNDSDVSLGLGYETSDDYDTLLLTIRIDTK